MLTNYQFGMALGFFYSCWMLTENKKSNFRKNMRLFRSYSKPIMQDLVNDIKPYLREPGKIYYDEFINIKNLLKHCLHRKVNKNETNHA